MFILGYQIKKKRLVYRLLCTEARNESGLLKQDENDTRYRDDNDDLTKGYTKLEGADNTLLG